MEDLFLCSRVTAGIIFPVAGNLQEYSFCLEVFRAVNEAKTLKYFSAVFGKKSFAALEKKHLGGYLMQCTVFMM